MAIFAKNIIALKAFIEHLESLLINVKGAVFGGERFKNVNSQVIDQGTERIVYNRGLVSRFRY